MSSPTAVEKRSKLADRCVTVDVAGSLFGLPIDDVQEILGARPLSRLFRVPPAIAGLASLRGDILAVLDLGELLGLAGSSSDRAPADARIVVVREREAPSRCAGLRVDGLGPVRDLPEGFEGLHPVPPTVPPSVRPFLRGVAAEPPLCAVLDVQRLFNARELADARELAAITGSRG